MLKKKINDGTWCFTVSCTEVFDLLCAELFNKWLLEVFVTHVKRVGAVIGENGSQRYRLYGFGEVFLLWLLCGGVTLHAGHSLSVHPLSPPFQTFSLYFVKWSQLALTSPSGVFSTIATILDVNLPLCGLIIT